LRNVYIDTAREDGFQPGPENFGYTIRAFCADTDEQAIEIGRTFMWTQDHRAPGPREHNDPPGYQSREAVRLQRARPQGAFGQRLSYAQLQDIDFYVLGNPATVTRKLRQLIERLNPGYLLIYGNEGDMAHKDVMRSIELLGKESSRLYTPSSSTHTSRGGRETMPAAFAARWSGSPQVRT
jgi:alkanesulfonate monooxygenase SsuD/methylene tetrahydromethanopterin reductase-like flavin-dependent oxidoreductase (luciferase family)